MIENYTTKMLLYEGIVAYRKKNYAESIEYFSQVINFNPDNELAYLCRGSSYLMLEKIEESISDFNRAIALNPLYARAYHQRGLARELKDDIANAYRDFDRALEIDPEFTAAYQSILGGNSPLPIRSTGAIILS
jgi:tetratricopeptide (TPR) repeat protein